MTASSPPVHLLIIHRGALGDFVLLFPVLQAVTRRPGGRVTLITRPSHGELARSLSLCSRCLSCDSGPGYRVICGDPVAAEVLLRETGPVDLCLAYLEDLDGTFTHLSAPCLGARSVVLSPRPRQVGIHAQDHLFSPLSKLGWPMGPLPALEAPGPGPFLIHPGSGSPRKNFDFLFYLKLQALLPESRFLLGPVEVEQDMEWPGEPLTPESLPALAEALRECRGLVCNDSGVGHLSAWLGVPTLSLFRTTDPAVWAPRGNGTAILQNPAPAAAAEMMLSMVHARV